MDKELCWSEGGHFKSGVIKEEVMEDVSVKEEPLDIDGHDDICVGVVKEEELSIDISNQEESSKVVRAASNTGYRYKHRHNDSSKSIHLSRKGKRNKGQNLRNWRIQKSLEGIAGEEKLLGGEELLPQSHEDIERHAEDETHPAEQRDNAQKNLNSSMANSSSLDATNDFCTLDSLEGRRIVDVRQLFSDMFKMANHAPMSCSIREMMYMSEKRIGLMSIFKFKCRMCNLEFVLHSEEHLKADSKDSSSANLSMVTGLLSIGCGFDQGEELASNLNMPFMAPKTFNKNESTLREK